MRWSQVWRSQMLWHVLWRNCAPYCFAWNKWNVTIRYSVIQPFLLFCDFAFLLDALLSSLKRLCFHRHLFVSLLAGLHKKTSIHKIRWKVAYRPQEKPLDLCCNPNCITLGLWLCREQVVPHVTGYVYPELFNSNSFARLWLGDRSFSITGPVVWNSLPVDLRTFDISLDHFKWQLKNVLIQDCLLMALLLPWQKFAL